ncbi:MAG: hypothetical protein RML56_12485 [Burkholderiales bacterium]|nr:hypothetical protein [Burkholderiales bacterium]
MREAAAKAGLTGLVERLADVEAMSGSKIGAAVVRGPRLAAAKARRPKTVAQLETGAVDLKKAACGRRAARGGRATICPFGIAARLRWRQDPTTA